ncbi:MAG: TonB-dependent receptor [Bacteroidaceae bacterium]|nr:TonB-dependent receptor [Bacteroidaceae bacterium]MBP9637259.1 TonB-dependent receptor [Bacteroidaceae bacterium]
MKENSNNVQHASRWRQFSHRSWAVFCSLHREVNIGVLAVGMLTFVNQGEAAAQDSPQQFTPSEVQELDELEVTASRVPLALSEASRIVTVITRQEIQAAPAQTITDLLKYVASIDIRQRGPGGVQADLSIRGGTADQLTILLNGANISNPNTGHNVAAFPVDLNDIERIEILEGPAARIYGTSAFSGAINIVTKAEAKSGASAQLSSGSYGLIEASGRGTFSTESFRNQLSAGYSRSDGYTAASDYEIGRGFYQGSYQQEQINVRWQAGIINKDFGANTFYSAKWPNQFEHTRNYFASVQAETKNLIHLTPIIYWNRAEDRFELIRGHSERSPYNYHRTDVYGLNLNSYFTNLLGKTSFGAEMRYEGILSTKLGELTDKTVPIPGTDLVYNHEADRMILNYYAEHDFQIENFSISIGALATRNTGIDTRFRWYPGIDLSYSLTPHQKFYASWNKALRVPTFTELWYTTNSTHIGNPNLKSEETQSFELGWKYTSSLVQATVRGYYHRGKNMIDWVKEIGSTETRWQSVNYTSLDNYGLEGNLTLPLESLWPQQNILKRLSLSYAYITQTTDAGEGYISQYALDYLRHKFVARLSHKINRKLEAEWSYRLQERRGTYSDISDKICKYSTVNLLDTKLTWTEPHYTLYAEATNLFGKTYYDLGNIPQPGFMFRTGIQVRL